MPARPDDQDFLDRAFDRALVAIEEGRDVGADDLLDGREHLRRQVEALIRVANEIAIGEVKPLAPVLPGYTVVGELGRGGMGSVYLARQERLGGRPVALKVLPPSLALSPRARERFRTEVHAIAKLHHPNIVSVFDLVEQSGVHAFAMEWVDGTSLAHIIESFARAKRAATMNDLRSLLRAPAGSIDAPTWPVFVCRIGIAIARALAVVHKEGLLHRDVKPSNVLLRRDGTPLLSDFGLVREADAETMSRSGEFVGTPAYAAPEQLRGDRAVGPTVDVYGLGATLYHALTLRAPYSGRGTAEILRQVEAGSALPIRRFGRDLPRDLETILAKAIDPDPKRRYATADEFADDLERLLNLEPIVARPAGVFRRALKLVHRNRRILFAALLGGVLVLGLGSVVVVRLFFVPRWVQEHVSAARLALLDPLQANLIFITEYFRVSNDPATAAIPTAAAEEALVSYRAALRLAPQDDAIRLEQETVRLALDLIRNPVAAPALGDRFLTLAPLTCDVVRKWPRPDGAATPEIQRLRAASPTDLRTLGLLYFLTGRIENAVRTWSELDLRVDADALVDACIGLVFLVRDEPARAYARLLQACEALPGVGFLTVYLADAAIRCGDSATGKRLLEAARGMDRQDPMSGFDRVEADLLAALGETRLARRRYRASSTGVSRSHLASLLEKMGTLQTALAVQLRVVEGIPRSERAAASFVALADRWWAEVGVDERWNLVRSSLDPSTPPPRRLVRLLCAYQPAVALLTEQNLLPVSIASRTGESSYHADPSATLARLSLLALSERFEASNQFKWEKWVCYPAPVKALQVAAWLQPDPAAGQRSVERLWQLWLAVVSLATRSVAPPSTCTPGSGFQGIGDLPGGECWTVATDLSADGSTVVGVSDSTDGPHAFRWRASGLPVDLGARVGDIHLVVTCADGSVVVGTRALRDALGNLRHEAFRWTAAGDLEGLGDLPGDEMRSEGIAVSPDGEEVLGASRSSSLMEIFRWTKATGIVGVGHSDRGLQTASSDWLTLIGTTRGTNPKSSWKACRWSPSSEPQLLGDLPGGTDESAARGTSSDGGVIVGSASSSAGREAMRWTAESGMVGLGDLTGGRFESSADTVSADGVLMGGFGTSSFGREAVIWSADGRMERAVDFLAHHGVRVPIGWFLTSVVDIARTGDRVAIAGNGFNPRGDREPWIAAFELSR
ncbi:MAG: protein kinase [Planctomycetes bacterium]|nr:protein kinase [Planctomycetota bacterium]